jgi:exodeoxyribonuclease-3
LTFNIATWNINSVRLRADLVCRLLKNEDIDLLCLQECKSPVEKIPLDVFSKIGFSHLVARGQKGYNGVAIISKSPLV